MRDSIRKSLHVFQRLLQMSGPLRHLDLQRSLFFGKLLCPVMEPSAEEANQNAAEQEQQQPKCGRPVWDRESTNRFEKPGFRAICSDSSSDQAGAEPTEPTRGYDRWKIENKGD